MIAPYRWLAATLVVGSIFAVHRHGVNYGTDRLQQKVDAARAKQESDLRRREAVRGLTLMALGLSFSGCATHSPPVLPLAPIQLPAELATPAPPPNFSANAQASFIRWRKSLTGSPSK